MKNQNEINAITERMHTLEKRINKMRVLGYDANADAMTEAWDKLKARRDALRGEK